MLSEPGTSYLNVFVICHLITADEVCRPVNLCEKWLNLEQIATEWFSVWIGSLDLYEHHIKSFPKVTDFKGPNLHKYKMAAEPDFNVQ